MALTRWILVSLFAVCAGGLSAQTTFTVSNTNDSGTGSLRDAITQANATTGADTIQFGVTGTITLTSALPVISENVTIDGPGRAALTIARNLASADFRIFETSVIGVELHINELTIQGGRAVQGGAIFSRGPTSLYDVLVQDCIAQGATSGGNAEGGAIYHSPAVAALLLTNSLIQNCQANGGDNASGNGGDGSGGGIYINAGTLGLLSTTIDNCDATGGDSTGGNGDGGRAFGGGIFAKFAATLTDSVVSNCSAAGGAGNGSGFGRGGRGGGIYGEGTITSLDTTWQSNSATGIDDSAFGGAINFAPSSTQQLTITRSVLTGNSATSTNAEALGAAINCGGVIEVKESTISGSTATSGSGGADTFHHENSSTLLIERSTISGNTGGLTIVSSSSASIINSTISGNTEPNGGGGITADSASVSVTFCTITLNNGGNAGGINVGSGIVTLIGTILAANTGPSAATADFLVSGGTLADGGGNFVGIDDASNFTNMATQAGSSGTPLNPMLGALADNGGLTFTHALLTGSSAIDMGGSTAVPSVDQRNAPRTVGSADAGAYEFGASVPSGQGSAGGEGDSRCTVSASGGNIWLMLLALMALAGLATRLRRAA
ncbi:MAG: choice-of-anchor Q domain-containing protein [Planctomycetota bacterium]